MSFLMAQKTLIKYQFKQINSLFQFQSRTKISNINEKRKLLKALKKNADPNYLRLTQIPINTDPDLNKGHDCKNFQSAIVNADKYWGDKYDDDHDFFEKQEKLHKDDIDRYEPLPIGQDTKKTYQVPQIVVMRSVYEMHKEKPSLWKVNKLASFFGLTSEQTKRYIMNGEVEDKIRSDFERCNDFSGGKLDREEKIYRRKRFPNPKENVPDVLGNHLSDNLHNDVVKKFNGKGNFYIPLKIYVNEVFNTRTGSFGFRQKLKLFGSTDDETLKFDLGSRVPKLVKREIPKNGPGSGKPIKVKKVKHVDSPMIITDISRKVYFKPFSRDIPTCIRNMDGSLRHTNVLEYNKVRQKERPNMACHKFSPH